MNHTINALMTKLLWQKNDLKLHVKEAQMQALQLKQQRQQLEDALNQLCRSPITINPEFEINRLNFTSQQQQKINQVNMDLKEKLVVEQQLNDKLLRVNTELKMLEKYMKRENQTLKIKQNKIQENTIELWTTL